MTDLVHALQDSAERQGDSKTVLELLARMQPEIEKALPEHLTGERFRRIVTTEIRRTPRLLECSPASLLGAVMLSAQLGLEPGPLGHVYLVPFKQEVTLIIGYRGMIDLSYRSGQLKSIDTGVVRVGDGFAYRKGTRPFLDHTPVIGSDDEPIAYYATAQLKTGGAPFVVMSPDEVEAIRKRSRNADGPNSPWTTDYAPMARKTAVRQLFRYLPVSPVMARALAVDGEPAPELDEGLGVDDDAAA